ncbi:Echinoderm microtubule-associated protein-like 1 [Tupaia chinensis]|uniref:Echinoderm microtubule-associated protein-like 1 n=2 Tax=Boreoeutheria TaxID=1437010 RepID=L9JA51_TUPCH|nr:Echinoderm microtubule-associated protein-like 1 [Tupaia chinensis]
MLLPPTPLLSEAESTGTTLAPQAQDDSASASSSMEVTDRIASLEQRVQMQEDDIQLLKSALADVVRRLNITEEQQAVLNRKGPTKARPLVQTLPLRTTVNNGTVLPKKPSGSLPSPSGARKETTLPAAKRPKLLSVAELTFRLGVLVGAALGVDVQQRPRPLPPRPQHPPHGDKQGHLQTGQCHPAEYRGPSLKAPEAPGVSCCSVDVGSGSSVPPGKLTAVTRQWHRSSERVSPGGRRESYGESKGNRNRTGSTSSSSSGKKNSERGHLGFYKMVAAWPLALEHEKDEAAPDLAEAQVCRIPPCSPGDASVLPESSGQSLSPPVQGRTGTSSEQMAFLPKYTRSQQFVGATCVRDREVRVSAGQLAHCSRSASLTRLVPSTADRKVRRPRPKPKEPVFSPALLSLSPKSQGKRRVTHCKDFSVVMATQSVSLDLGEGVEERRRARRERHEGARQVQVQGAGEEGSGRCGSAPELGEFSLSGIPQELRWLYALIFSRKLQSGPPRGRDCRNNLYLLPTGETVYFIASVVVLFDVEEQLQRHYVGHSDDVKWITIATGQVAGTTDGGRQLPPHVRIWDSVTLNTLHVIGIGFFDRAVTCIAFSKSNGGSHLCAVDDSNDHVLSVWDWQKEEKLADVKCSNEAVFAVDFHPTDTSVLVTCGKSHLYFWTLEGSALIKKQGLFERQEKPKFVLCVTFSENGDTITGDSSGNILVWGKGTNRISHAVQGAHEGGIFALCMLRDGTLVSGGGKDRKLISWNGNYQKLHKTEIPEQFGPIRTVAEGKGDIILIGTTRNFVLQGTLSGDFTPITQGHTDELWGLAVHASKPQFLTCGHDKHATLWDAVGHRPIWDKIIEDPAQSSGFHPSGSVVAVGTLTGRWFVFDTETKDLVTVHTDGNEQLSVMRYSPALDTVMSTDMLLYLGVTQGFVMNEPPVARATEGFWVLLVDGAIAPSPQVATRFQHCRPLCADRPARLGLELNESSAPSTSARTATPSFQPARSGTRAHTRLVCFRQQQTGPAVRRFDRNQRGMTSEEDGNFLAIGSHDNCIYIYGVSDNGRKYARVGKCSGHSSFITHLDWSVNSQFLVSNSGDYEILYWVPSACKQVVSVEATRDIEWATYTCTLGFHVFEGSDGTDINAVCRAHEKKLLSTGDDFGKVHLFSYPCSQFRAPSLSGGPSSHVTNVDFLCEDSHLISTGGKDTSIMQWRVV